MVDNRTPSTSQPFETTPEATPIEATDTATSHVHPASAASPETDGGALSSLQPVDSRSGPTGKAVEELTETVREIADKLKPVAVVAEDVASRAVDLSVKGLTKVAAVLEDRRRGRGKSGQE